VRPSPNEGWVPHLPRFPVELGGVDTLHAPFLNERRTRGPLWRSVAGNRGQARFWLEWDTTALDAPFFVIRRKPGDLQLRVAWFLVERDMG
jgi:hypothetical protein